MPYSILAFCQIQKISLEKFSFLGGSNTNLATPLQVLSVLGSHIPMIKHDSMPFSLDEFIAMDTWLLTHDGRKPPPPEEIEQTYRKFIPGAEWKFLLRGAGRSNPLHESFPEFVDISEKHDNMRGGVPCHNDVVTPISLKKRLSG